MYHPHIADIRKYSNIHPKIYQKERRRKKSICLKINHGTQCENEFVLSIQDKCCQLNNSVQCKYLNKIQRGVIDEILWTCSATVTLSVWMNFYSGSLGNIPTPKPRGKLYLRV